MTYPDSSPKAVLDFWKGAVLVKREEEERLKIILKELYEKGNQGDASLREMIEDTSKLLKASYGE